MKHRLHSTTESTPSWPVWIACFAGACVAGLWPSAWETPLVLSLTALASLHGGFDLAILLRFFGLRPALLWSALYAATVLLGILLYRWQPVLGASLLLVLSAWHFGLPTAQATLRFSSGAVLLSAVIYWHMPLRYLLPITSARAQLSAPTLWMWLCALSLLIFALALIAQYQRAQVTLARWRVLEWLFWLGLIPLCRAPVWFALFFLLQHSREHMVALARAQLLGAWNFALATFALVCVILPLWLFRAQLNFDLDAIFAHWLAPILLGLTLAHGALIDGYQVLARMRTQV
jgi:hypothetical protein